jgi:hypothetical protein
VVEEHPYPHLHTPLSSPSPITLPLHHTIPDNMSEDIISPPTLSPPTVEQLQQQITQLQSYIISLHPHLTNQSQSKGIKVAPPDSFDGTQSKTDSFLSQLGLYFSGRKKEFQDDQDKIIFALSYMKGGTAGPWAAEVVRQYQDSPEPLYPDWNTFLQEFKAAFGDPDPGSTARFKMDQLKQGSHSVEEYVAKFKELASQTKYNDAAHIEKFEKGLNSALVDKIYSLPEMPDTLTGWITWATKLDRQWRQREARKKALGPPTPQKPFRSQPLPVKTPQVSREPAVVPMEIDSGKKRLGPMVCYKCRKPGHIARNCQSSVDISTMDYEAIKALVMEDLKNEQPRTYTISKEGF